MDFRVPGSFPGSCPNGHPKSGASISICEHQRFVRTKTDWRPNMAGGLFKKLIGGGSQQELNSCCGAVSVTEEEDETPQAETPAKVDVRAEETSSR
ncbi:hypothetical protein [Nocardiopsis sp. ATB16-24]|uniref:hypothetical protein n=1 Tax=Nocardiopsis sp. ATB16-24 TaxID=3019555 RepID=UPI002556F66F|nr:hypothetical protein [Nocardiopsis sp. ATB16-24]